MLLAEELPLSSAESKLLELAREFSRREVGPNAARVAHYADGTTEIQNERIAAYLERAIPGETTASPQ